MRIWLALTSLMATTLPASAGAQHEAGRLRLGVEAGALRTVGPGSKSFDDVGMGVGARAGYNFILGPDWVTPELAIEWSRLGGAGDAWILGLLPGVRIDAGRSGIWAALRVGYQRTSDDDNELGVQPGVGWDFVFTRNVSAGIAVRYTAVPTLSPANLQWLTVGVGGTYSL